MAKSSHSGRGVSIIFQDSKNPNSAMEEKAHIPSKTSRKSRKSSPATQLQASKIWIPREKVRYLNVQQDYAGIMDVLI